MTHPLLPTTVLPPLATLHACSAARIGEALRALGDVYFPHAQSSVSVGAVPVLRQSLAEAVPALRPKKTARLVHHYDGVPDSGYASAEEDDQDEEGEGEKKTRSVDANAIDEDETEMLRPDEIERGYAIKWLTGLMKRGDAWVCGTPSSEEREARTMGLEDASRLLARFAGDDTPEEAVTRTFVFPLRMPSCVRCGRDGLDAPTITVELNDAPVDGTDHTAVGLQSWGSAIVFAERMCFDPERYLGALHRCTSVPVATIARPLRVLELGAGTGLLSITAAQIFSQARVRAEISATDFHPSVLENLAQNVRHNPSAVGVSVDKLDWCAVDETRGPYDVVLAADVVYHPEHAHWIRGCIGRTLDKGGVFWMIIPMRTIGRHKGLETKVEEAFPVAGEGDRLAIVRREEVERVDGVGRADEGGYTLFEIRWASSSSYPRYASMYPI